MCYILILKDNIKLIIMYRYRYFLLVVAVYAHIKNKEYLVCANVSERIIVRVSKWTPWHNSLKECISILNLGLMKLLLLLLVFARHPIQASLRMTWKLCGQEGKPQTQSFEWYGNCFTCCTIYMKFSMVTMSVTYRVLYLVVF